MIIMMQIKELMSKNVEKMAKRKVELQKLEEKSGEALFARLFNGAFLFLFASEKA